MNNYDILWQTILSELEQTYDEDAFAEVFEPLQNIHHVNSNVIYIVTPNEFIKNRIQRLYLSKIQDLALKNSGETLRFKFVLESELEPEYD
ncbi:MAG: DnaA N-terminal domain-containing protein, partial [Acholeplasmataceae bacterium]